MFFLPILGNCNLEFISDIIIFRKPAVLTEALVLRKHCMWPQPLRLINLLLRYLQAQVSATLEISPSLITVYKMTITHLWVTNIHPLMVSWGQLQSFMYKIGILLLHVLGVARSQSGCADGCHLHFVRGICSSKFLKMKNSMKVTSLHRHQRYVIQRRDSKAYSWKPLCLFSVGYTGVCEACELITSSPFVWAMRIKVPLFSSGCFKHVCVFMKDVVVVQLHSQDRWIQKLGRDFSMIHKFWNVF